MTADLTWLSWLKLAAAILLFLGPGFGLVAFYPGRDRLDRTQTATLALGLAISGWAVLLAWLQLFHITLTPPAMGVVFAVGWVVWLVRARVRGEGENRLKPPLQSARSDWNCRERRRSAGWCCGPWC